MSPDACGSVRFRGGSARMGLHDRRPHATVRYMPNHSAALDSVFQALADPTRRTIVERLVRGPASVSELARPLAMKLPSVLQHLGVLEDSGLVHSEKQGRVRVCRIEPAVMRSAEQWMTGRRATWERHLDVSGDHLAETATEPHSRRKKS